jgi:hypothetical protein
MKNADQNPATLESVWEAFRESERLRKESEARFDREIEKSRAEFKQEMAESRAGFVQEMTESRAEFKLRMKNLDEMIGGVGNSNGAFAEEFFFNTLEYGDKIIFGEHFDECYSTIKRYNKENRKKSEHDILLVNGKSVAIVEVKYKARKEDIQKMLDRLPDFRTLYPQYNDHRIYLGLAAMSFDDGVEDKSAMAGIAIVKQVGDTIIISDENLKIF